MKRPFDQIDDARLNRQPARSDRDRSLADAAAISFHLPSRLRLRCDKILDRSFGKVRLKAGAFPHISPLDSIGIYSRPDEVRAKSDENCGVPFAVACANTCSLVAMGHESGIVKVFDHSPSDRTFIQNSLFEIRPHHNAVFHTEWSADDRTLAVASGDQRLTMVDVQTQTITSILSGHTGTVKDIKFDPSNPNLCTSGARDGMLAVWDLRTSSAGHIKPVVTINAAHGYTHIGSINRRLSKSPTNAVSITALLYKPDGTILSACASDAILRTWDMRYARTDTPKAYGRGEYPFLDLSIPCPSKKTAELRVRAGESPAAQASHERKYGITSLTISHDRQRIYAMNKNNKVLEYPTSHPSSGPTNVFECPTLAVKTFYCKSSISSDGLLVCGNASGQPVIIDTNHRPSTTHTSRTPTLYDTPQASQDQENISSQSSQSSSSSSSSLSPINHAKSTTSHQTSRKSSTYSRQLNGGHTLECTAPSWSHDSQSFITIGDDSIVRIWRRDERRKAAEVMACEAGVSGDWGWL